MASLFHFLEALRMDELNQGRFRFAGICFLGMHSSMICKKPGRFSHPLHPRTAVFYLLPKIHKPRNPGRPIVSLCEGPTARRYPISWTTTYDLMLHHTSQTQQLPVESLNNLPDDALLVTLDVTSLYTNIPHSEGIDAC